MVAWLALNLLRLRPAARAWLAVTACVLCVALPIASLVARSQGVGVLAGPTVVMSESVEVEAPRSETTTLAIEPPTIDTAPDGEVVSPALPEPATAIEDAVVSTSAPTEQAVAAHAIVTPSQQPTTLITSTNIWHVITIAWLLLASCLLVRLLIVAFGFWRMCREAIECKDVAILQCSDEAAKRMQLKQTPRVLISQRTGCPALVTWLRPHLVIPPPREERSNDHWLGVFSHEFAHLQRGDGWTRLLIELTTIALPWQPFIWWLRREYRLASEEACDDWAVYAGADPVDYAALLTEWIPRHSSALAPGISGWPSMVRRRIERLINATAKPQPHIGGLWFATTTLLAFVLLVSIALLQPGAPQTFGEDASIAPVNVVSTNERPTSNDQTTRKSPITRVGTSRFTQWNRARVLGFTSDSASLVSTSDDGLVRMWNTGDGTKAGGFSLPRTARGSEWWNWAAEAQAKSYVDVEFSRTTGKAFVLRANGSIEEVDPIDRSHRRVYQATTPVTQLVASGNGRYLALRHLNVDELQNHVSVLDVTTGKIVGEVGAAKPDGNSQWTNVAVTSSGESVAIGRRGVVEVWDVRSAKLVWSQAGHTENESKYRIFDLAFSSDDRMLASSAVRGPVFVWDVQSGKQLSALPHRSQVDAVAFSPDNTTLASVAEDGRLVLWDIETSKRKKTFRVGPNGGVIDQVAWSSNAKYIVTANGDGTVCIVDVDAG